MSAYSLTQVTTPSACLYGAMTRGQHISQLNVAYLDSPGHIQSGQGVILNTVTPIGYKLLNDDNGLPVLSVDYYYNKITIDYSSGTHMCWDVALNTSC